VADLIDYKLVDPRSHISHPAFVPRGNFVFRTFRYLIFRARHAAPAQPCFSADKLNRPFYFGPRYILTAPRSRRSSCFFSFPPSRTVHSRRDITAPYMSRVYPSFPLSLFLWSLPNKFPAINSQRAYHSQFDILSSPRPKSSGSRCIPANRAPIHTRYPITQSFVCRASARW